MDIISEIPRWATILRDLLEEVENEEEKKEAGAFPPHVNTENLRGTIPDE